MVALSSLPTDAEMLVRYGLKLAAGSVPCYAVNVLRRRKGFLQHDRACGGVWIFR